MRGSRLLEIAKPIGKIAFKIDVLFALKYCCNLASQALYVRLPNTLQQRPWYRLIT
jgi:hypothetical protein